MDMDVKYDNIDVQLTGTDSNVGALMYKVSQAMQRAGVSQEEITNFREEVMESESYDQALSIMMHTVNVS